jgi:hypothetical protein
MMLRFIDIAQKAATIFFCLIDEVLLHCRFRIFKEFCGSWFEISWVVISMVQLCADLVAHFLMIITNVADKVCHTGSDKI